MNDNLQQWREKRNKALIALDLEWARSEARLQGAGRPAPDDMTLLAAMHKARYDCRDMPAELRHESGAWLRERGMRRVGGLPLLPEGELPTYMP